MDAIIWFGGATMFMLGWLVAALAYLKKLVSYKRKIRAEYKNKLQKAYSDGWNAAYHMYMVAPLPEGDDIVVTRR